MYTENAMDLIRHIILMVLSSQIIFFKKGVLQGKAYLYYKGGRLKETLQFKDGVRTDCRCVVM